MSNSMSDDYFSFMSAKGEKEKKDPKRLAVAPTSVMPTDIVDYVEDEPTIEVTESFVSDTTIQRIFKMFAAGTPEATAAAPGSEPK